MSALLDNGLEVTALHNHFFWDEPRMFFMHVHGMGTPAALATKLKPAFAMIGKPAAMPSPHCGPASLGFDAAAIGKIVGTPAIRPGPCTRSPSAAMISALKDMGATLNARMGLNTWAAFVGTDCECGGGWRRGDAGQRGHTGIEGAAPQRSTGRRHPSPHDNDAADDLLPALLGYGASRQARDRLQSRPESTREEQYFALSYRLVIRRARRCQPFAPSVSTSSITPFLDALDMRSVVVTFKRGMRPVIRSSVMFDTRQHALQGLF